MIYHQFYPYIVGGLVASIHPSTPSIFVFTSGAAQILDILIFTMSTPAANTQASFASTKKNPPAPGGAIKNPTERGGATPTPAGRGGATTAFKPSGPGLLKHPPEGTYVEVVRGRQQVTPLRDAIIALPTTTPRPGRYDTGLDDEDNGTGRPPSPPRPDRDTGSDDDDLGDDGGFTQLSETSRNLLTPPPVHNKIHPTTPPPPAAD